MTEQRKDQIYFHLATEKIRLLHEADAVEKEMREKCFLTVLSSERRAELAMLARSLCLDAIVICNKLDHHLFASQKLPRFLRLLKFCERGAIPPEVMRAINQRVTAHLKAFILQAIEGPEAFALAQISQAISVHGIEMGLKRTEPLRALGNLRSSADFQIKLGRRIKERKNSPGLSLPKLIEIYWLALRLWQLRDDDAHTDFDAAQLLTGQDFRPDYLVFKLALKNAKARMFGPNQSNLL